MMLPRPYGKCTRVLMLIDEDLQASMLPKAEVETDQILLTTMSCRVVSLRCSKGALS